MENVKNKMKEIYPPLQRKVERGSGRYVYNTINVDLFISMYMQTTSLIKYRVERDLKEEFYG